MFGLPIEAAILAAIIGFIGGLAGQFVATFFGARYSADLSRDTQVTIAAGAREAQRQLERDKAISAYRTAILRPFLERADSRVREYVEFAMLMSDITISDQDLRERFHATMTPTSIFLMGPTMGALASGSVIRMAADDLATTENQWLQAVADAVMKGDRSSPETANLTSYWSGQYTGRLDQLHRVAIDFIFGQVSPVSQPDLNRRL